MRLPHEDVAQSVEHMTFNHGGVGSIPTILTILWVTIPIGRETWLRTMKVWVQIPGDPPYALVAQLAEALGLGPRGSGFESLAAHH